MGARISFNDSGLRARFVGLRDKEIPSAMRNTVRDLAFDTRKRVITEVQRVFDRPTPIVQKMPQVKNAKEITKENPVAELWITDWFSSARSNASRALIPHIPGEPNTRAPKGLEYWLRQKGLIDAHEWVVPSKFAKLDQYGNMPGSVVAKILADLAVYDAGGIHGVRNTTRKAKKYDWIYWTSRNRKITRGIGTEVKGLTGKWSVVPVMVVIQKTPTYAKRFRFHDVARLYAQSRLAYHADRAIAQAIRKRG